MNVIVSSGTTKSSSGTFLAAHTFDAPGGEKVCLLLHVDGGRGMETIEDECIGIVRHSLLSTEGESWHRLDGTLKELNGLFKGVLLGDTVEGLHAVVMLLDADGALHVSHAGRGEAYLVRGGGTSQITEYTRGKPLSAFVHISSGTLEQGDTVILSTTRLLRSFTPAQLAGLSGRKGSIDEIVSGLESEREEAAVSILALKSDKKGEEEEAPPVRSRGAVQRRGSDRRRGWMPSTDSVRAGLGKVLPFLSGAAKTSATLGKRGAEVGKSTVPLLSSASGSMMRAVKTMGQKSEEFLADLRHPERKRRAHFLLLAAAIAAFLIILLIFNLLTSSQRSKTKTELADRIAQIETEIRTADNRKLAGDSDAANTILQRAEEGAKQVIENESGLYRTEALDLLDRIRQKREELNNIVRLAPRVLVNLSTKSSDISAQGLIGIGDGEMVVFDRQNSYRVLLNRLDDPRRVSDEDLVLLGTPFARFNSQVFLTTASNLVEMNSNQLTPMKTEDPDGWKTGKDMEAYLRYLYLLSPADKQIYKYERLTNRYGPPVQYNVNGELSKAIDMAIDGSVYVLSEGGTVQKLLRGEVQPFTIRNLPKDALIGVTKMFKVTDGSFYFLDPESHRVIVVADGGLTGEAAYTRQYVLEGDQIGTLQDLYIEPEENNLYVLDEKRVYAVDLVTR